MKLTEAVAIYLNHCRTRQRAAGTIDSYRYQLEELWLAWRIRRQLPERVAEIAETELQEYFAYLAHEHVNRRTGGLGVSAQTINSSWRALRAFWNVAKARGWLSPAQYDLFNSSTILLPPVAPPPAQPSDGDAVLAKLLEACDMRGDQEERARNRAIIALLAAGLHVSELAALDDETVDQQERRARIVVEGNRVLWVCWGYQAAMALQAYLAVRTGAVGGALFRSLHGPATGQRLSASSIRRLLAQLNQRAGVSWQPSKALLNLPRYRNR